MAKVKVTTAQLDSVLEYLSTLEYVECSSIEKDFSLTQPQAQAICQILHSDGYVEKFQPEDLDIMGVIIKQAGRNFIALSSYGGQRLSMTKKKASKALNDQLKKLNKNGDPDEYWLNETREYFRRIFGEDSLHYKSLTDIQYHVVPTGDLHIIITTGKTRDWKDAFRRVLLKAIEATKSELFEPFEKGEPAEENQDGFWGWLATHKTLTFWGVVIGTIGLITPIVCNDIQNNDSNKSNSHKVAPEKLLPVHADTNKKNPNNSIRHLP